MTFKELGLIDPILKALADKGYTHPTPIQQQAIPVLLKGKDLLGSAQTGTGKTAAFTIPILQQIYDNIGSGKGGRKLKALIITPTRELAIQIDDNVTEYSKYTGIKNTVIFGGVKQAAQVNAMRKGVDVLTATPGRLLDLVKQGFISLKDIEYLVLDEADQMLDMGFIHDIKKVLKLVPHKRQSLFFSATMPKAIVDLSKLILGDFEKVSIAPEKPTAERVDQSVYFVSKKSKAKLLEHLIETENPETVLVFSRTKHGANKIVKILDKSGINAAAIHGNKSQAARQKALSAFKDGKTQVLVATDIAARGIDVSELELVIQYDLPNVPETYVHRIGRTGRAKASGIALSFCAQDERPYLKDIEKLIKQKIHVIAEHPFLVDPADEESQSSQDSRPKNNNRNSNRNRSQNSSSRPKKQTAGRPNKRFNSKPKSE
ncbi:DEAD/DEAH box helicase [Leeuwenhoekiella marinoflava]|uniref:DEAD-box ATP-dependent RNA helicase RhpA n=2 Tax=Leeuwenhoekiella marinoflava TaxID=988 RepID=A0A4Q0PKW1_9FLAO|nr:DEAD/DEAH box helicase [Leeuwenhoekiella marinoflava]RXG29092.1 ATP-dependent RNA helicase RhlE [Leeuwenhoekiella marinoflava]SHF47674.1 ATP-dependent RNA helicase RhlE [Leeuwenhoekiella marinoflava DSM 3653]